MPDAVDAITSNAGWDTIKHQSFLQEVILNFNKTVFELLFLLDTDLKQIEAAAKTGADRIELYTEEFATQFEFGQSVLRSNPIPMLLF